LKKFEDILVQCIEDIKAGRSSIEDCLDRYPSMREQLGPLLRIALEIREPPDVKPSPTFKVKARVQLMDQIHGRQDVTKWPWSRYNSQVKPIPYIRRFSMARVIVAAVAISVAVLAVLGVVYWAPGTPEQPLGTGTLRLYLSDAPLDAENVTGVYITINEIQYHRDGQWTTCEEFEGPQTYNLLELTAGNSALLGELTLPAGNYTQIRFMLDIPEKGPHKTNPGCYIEFADNSTEPLFAPSGAQTGYKAKGQFEVTANGTVKVTADFDVHDPKAIHVAGSRYILNPTIKLLVNDQSDATDEDSDESEQAVETGTLKLYLSDAPLDAENVTGVYITINEIQYHLRGQWITCEEFVGNQTYNLLELTGGNSTLLGGFELPVGNYTQIRFMLDIAEKGSHPTNPGCYIEFADNSTEPLFVPSGNETGYKAVGHFEVPVNGTVEVTADFDVRKAVVVADSLYILKPTIKLIVND
jgi:hypothetical protein